MSRCTKFVNQHANETLEHGLSRPFLNIMVLIIKINTPRSNISQKHVQQITRFKYYDANIMRCKKLLPISKLRWVILRITATKKLYKKVICCACLAVKTCNEASVRTQFHLNLKTYFSRELSNCLNYFLITIAILPQISCQFTLVLTNLWTLLGFSSFQGTCILMKLGPGSLPVLVSLSTPW